MGPLRLVLWLCAAFSAAGCKASIDVSLADPPSRVSAQAIQGGALVEWSGGSARDLVLRLEPPSGSGLARVEERDVDSPIEIGALVPLVAYRVSLYAPGADEPATPEVTVVPLPIGLLDPAPLWSTSGATAGAGFGTEVAFAGDLDGDDVPDLAVGAPNVEQGEILEGAVFVYSGAVLTDSPAVLTIDTAGAMFGASLAGRPGVDVDGDGFDDLLVSAPFPFAVSDTGGSPAGVLHAFLGSDAGLEPVPLVFPGVQSDLFGSAVAARDFDKDGRAEIWVGGPGASRVTLLSSTVTSFSIAAATATRLGTAVAIGDLDGDGDDDLVAGEPLFGEPLPDEELFAGAPNVPFRAGRVQVLYNDGGESFSGSPVVGTTAGQLVGSSVAVADLDADGAAELIAASTSCAVPGSGNQRPGMVQVWAGAAGGIASESPSQVIPSTSLCFASSLVVADVDGDGFPDLVTGDPIAGDEGVETGELASFRGDGNGGFDLAVSVLSGGSGERLGRALASGDLGADGYVEILAGGNGGAGVARLFEALPLAGPRVTVSGSVEGAAFDPRASQFEAQHGRAVEYTCTWIWGDGFESEHACAPGAPLSTAPLHAFTPGTWDVRLVVRSTRGQVGESAVRILVR